MNYLIQPLRKKLSNLLPFQKIKNNKHAFILYKIVDSDRVNNNECYKVQCINTKAVLSLVIEEIVFDLTILHGLHPIQGCFIGLEYAEVIKKTTQDGLKNYIKYQNILKKYSVNRYGNNNLEYQDGSGRLGFRCGSTEAKFLMDPRDIAFTRELIGEFDAAQAFCIGLLAGLKFINHFSKDPYKSTPEKSNLHLVDKK